VLILFAVEPEDGFSQKQNEHLFDFHVLVLVSLILCVLDFLQSAQGSTFARTLSNASSDPQSQLNEVLL